MKVVPFFVEFFRLTVYAWKKYLSKIILLNRFHGYIYITQSGEILIVADDR